MPSLGAAGSRQLRAIAHDLKAAGAPSGMRLKVRRNISAAVEPMKKQVQQNALAIPAMGRKSTGLRQAIAAATRISISTGTRQVLVRLLVDPKRMPAGQQRLPLLMEGDGIKWRHPVHATDTWVNQASHPYFRPAVASHLAGVVAGVNAALQETAAELSRGI